MVKINALFHKCCLFEFMHQTMTSSLYDVHDVFLFRLTHFTWNLTLRRRVEVRNPIQRFKTQERTIEGICSKGLLRKSTYSCGNHVIVKFKNPNYNTFVVKIAAVNDTDTFVKPRECKIGNTQHTNQLIPRNPGEKSCIISWVNAPESFRLKPWLHPFKLCSLLYNTKSK